MNGRTNASIRNFKAEIAATINFRARELDHVVDTYNENILVRDIMIDELKFWCDQIKDDTHDMNKEGYLGWKRGIFRYEDD